jgi:hypothetical protein
VPVDSLHGGVIVDRTRVTERGHDLNVLTVDTFTLHRQNLVEKGGRFAQRRFIPGSWRRLTIRVSSRRRWNIAARLERFGTHCDRVDVALVDSIDGDDSWPGVEAIASALATHRVLPASEARALCWKALRNTRQPARERLQETRIIA